MGRRRRRGGWIYAVKKVFSCESEEKRERKKNGKPGNRIEKQRSINSNSSSTEDAVKLMAAENEQNRQAYSVAVATAVAAEAAVAAANAAAEVVRLAQNMGKTKEELAAVKIQTVFRGYLARRALRALRGLVRLKTLVGGQSVKRQATSTLRCMQTLARVQSEIRTRRTRISEENSALQQHIQQKREKELEKLRASIAEEWDDSMQSKERIEANLQHRIEASVRRERALAYAYSHQQTWRNSTDSPNQTFMDPNNPRWGWSWLERWMAARPWENNNGTTVDKEQIGDHVSLKSIHNQPPSRQSPSTPKSRLGGKIRPSSPRGTIDDESKSVNSVQSDRCRRHSIAGTLSIRDDESLASSPAVFRSYMASTESARAKSRSPLGLDNVGTPETGGGGGGGGGSAKKRLSFSGSPAGPRRHSGPPKIDMSS